MPVKSVLKKQIRNGFNGGYEMAKKTGCKPCQKKLKNKMKLLKKAIRDGLPFEEAVEYAGLPTNNLTKAYNDLMTNLKGNEKQEIIDLITWS